ncbi:MAG: DUF2284 domain-containing protein [Clostridia bacterium]|nr:DUF2284 domain-containing protein [Clostridia bacterium]
MTDIQTEFAPLLASLPSTVCSIHESVWISPCDLPFSAEVRSMCEVNRCGKYGTSWSCPPGCGEWETLRDEFCACKSAFVFTTCHILEDSFDIEGMQTAAEDHQKLDNAIAEALSRTDLRYIHLGMGTCILCKTCTYPDAPCRHPDKMRRPPEACGIDVCAMSKAIGIRYMNGPDTVTYFSILLFK